MSGETSAGRDPHLAAVRRGGLLSTTDHQRLVAWAADCAERVLPLFEIACPGDARSADALAVARAWAAGDAEARPRAAAVAAHAAAREAHGPAALAARACGHAVATAHMADHELGAAFYALRALEAAGAPPAQVEAERAWQRSVLPSSVADLVTADMRRRSAKFRGAFD